MIDHIVLDVEVQKGIEEVQGGWDATDKLGVACAVIYEFRTDRYLVYGPKDVPALQARLLKAHRISGVNTWAFDFPVIWSMPGRERVAQLWGASDDLLRRIWIAKGLDPDKFGEDHKGWGLFYLSTGTLGRGKTGYGGDAPKWFQAGDWPRVVTYCIDDVKLTRDLTRFVDRYGFVVSDKKGLVRLPRWVDGPH